MYASHHSIKFISAKSSKASFLKPKKNPPPTSYPLLTTPSRKIHSHAPPLPNTPRHKHNRSNNQRAKSHTPDRNPRNLLGVKHRPALDLNPVRQSRKTSPVTTAPGQVVLLAGGARAEPEGVVSGKKMFVRDADMVDGSGNGWMNGNLPVILQSRHFPSRALGAGGRVDEVVCDFAHGFPAVVGVGGAVHEEEVVDYLLLE